MLYIIDTNLCEVFKMEGKKNYKNGVPVGYSRVVVNVPDKVNEKFKEMAKDKGMAKSQMIIYALNWYLDYSQSLDLMPKMIEALKTSDDKNSK